MTDVQKDAWFHDLIVCHCQVLKVKPDCDRYATLSFERSDVDQTIAVAVFLDSDFLRPQMKTDYGKSILSQGMNTLEIQLDSAAAEPAYASASRRGGHLALPTDVQRHRDRHHAESAHDGN